MDRNTKWPQCSLWKQHSLPFCPRGNRGYCYHHSWRPRGWLWFATANGLYIQKEDELLWVSISEASGANRVVSMVFDGENYLWIGTFNGAYRLNLADFYGMDYQEGQKVGFEHYTRKDGLPNLECNANAAFRDSKGNIWLGTVAGAIQQPSGLERVENTNAPRVFVTGVRSRWLGEG